MGDFTIFGIPISIGTMLYQAIIFTILVFILKRFFIKKLVDVLETRKMTIEKQLKLAQEYEHQAQIKLQEQTELTKQAKAEYNRQILDANTQSNEMIRKAKQEAIQIRSQAYNDMLYRKERDQNEKKVQ